MARDPDRDELELAPTESPALAARPPPDKLARDVARARIANQLFASDRRVKLGRYHLLDVVGSGGMGVVWSAYDPELDRKVAIKLLKPELAAARDRIVREGQALAKLSHPNVVPVFDVGVVDDQVYLVMEWVRGETLRAWASTPRSVHEIVAAYRAAGDGLAAAHAAGLIHRDFKPDNVMRGDDGRVRVLDFGLARGELDGPEVAGTPRYMAPEQRDGGALTPAVDQYALGISLGEALEAPPRWLADIVARATAAKPADRFASMAVLVAALGRDPATVRRRRLAVAGAVAFAGAAFAVGTLRAGGGGAEPCSGVDAELATTWNAHVRDTLADHLRGLGPFGVATAATLDDVLGRYATAWTESRRGTCRAHGAGELPAATYERDLRCLARARSSLAAATDALASTDRDRLPSTLLAVRGLP
ncbi:MAG TPA: serine/threonine-protein kinase, partial [Kofleriaceae bacterium]|nr:serine/threonine-protein kinase [Kofleriaceae bacterium]